QHDRGVRLLRHAGHAELEEAPADIGRGLDEALTILVRVAHVDQDDGLAGRAGAAPRPVPAPGSGCAPPPGRSSESSPSLAPRGLSRGESAAGRRAPSSAPGPPACPPAGRPSGTRATAGPARRTAPRWRARP